MALDLADKTSNGNDLTNSGVAEETTIVPAGLSGATNSAKFEDSGPDLLYNTSATNLDFNVTFTVEWWMYINSLDTTAQWLFENSETNRGWLIFIEGTGDTLRAQITGAAGTDRYRYNTALATGEWNHWAITCDASNPAATTFEWFKNGSSVGNGVQTNIPVNLSSFYNSNPDIHIGAASTVAAGFDGYMKDVRVWNDVRTSTEISNNYQSFLVGNEAGLVAYYPFEALSAGTTRRYYSPGIWRAV